MNIYVKLAIGCGSVAVAGIAGYFGYKKLSKKEEPETEDFENENKEEIEDPQEDEGEAPASDMPKPEPEGKLTWPGKEDKPSLEDLVNDIILDEGYSSMENSTTEEPKKNLAELSCYKVIDAEKYLHAAEYEAYRKVTCSYFPDVERLVNLTDNEVIVHIGDEIGPDAFEQLRNSKENDELYCANHAKMICYEIITVNEEYDSEQEE